ncbi:helix-turn-helix domain-containing protein [Sphingomonas colocasiae]|uniref:Helix-turn-helix domain-containing protein n=1 Tax=Sphingomonas colocasiae TaxID=1848973 RepID=A0ABS7PIG5_9SPHN|nr:helix-turn-helix transcriptional regulator [Sphingomonas colocasiae]MBY8821043.1 helix-turn-helix domain-containing protein [Sphingomonas colocasiae]
MAVITRQTFISNPQNIPKWDIPDRDIFEALSSLRRSVDMPGSAFSDASLHVTFVLREARKNAGLTQVQLAVALGKPQSFVAKVERGERRIGIVEFIEWANALGIAAVDLFAKVEQGIRTTTA